MEKQENTMEIRLSSPGMTALHKAGLAGLWMTLRALDGDYLADGEELRAKGLNWEYLDNNGVRFRWKGPSVFMQLFDKAFRIDNKGLFWFPALGNPQDSPEHAVMLQEAILGTILQHGRSRKADKKEEAGGILTDESSGIFYKFRKIYQYSHQREKYCPDKASRIVGTLYPGGAQRHVAYSNTKLEEIPERAIALRFLPIGTLFFKIQQWSNKKTAPRHVMVIPQIDNLNIYSQIRREFLIPESLHIASGATAAAFRVIATSHARRLLGENQLPECRIFAFGTVPWSSQQKTKVQVFSVQASAESNIRTWRYAEQYFPIKKIRKERVKTKKQEADFYWQVPQMLELIANNLAYNQPWWYKFSQFCEDKERREHILGIFDGKIFPGEKYYVDDQRHKTGGIASMIKNTETFPEGRERIFVSACHEAWRRRLAKDMENAKNRGTRFDYGKAFEKQRIVFSRCKNAASIREAVIDFWARGTGSLPSLQGNWNEVLGLFDDNNWRLARDLALLSLASYKPQPRHEQSESDDQITEGSES